MFKNFFRKDLNLKDRWWHRLLFVCFVVCFLAVMLFSLVDLLSGNEFPQWVEVATLDDRITSGLNAVNSYKLEGEEISDSSFLNYNREIEKSFLSDIYCSSELYDNFEQLQFFDFQTSIHNGEIKYGRDFVTADEFEMELYNNDIKCVSLDSYTVDGEKVYFFNPDKSYYEDLSFYKKSTIKSVLYFIGYFFMFLGILALYGVGIVVIYYKVILYIIFGKAKKEKLMEDIK